MATLKQDLGLFGEQRVVADCTCPKCKGAKTLVRLPSNFKCADIICDFCGYLGQVKASRVKRLDVVPKAILGAAWRPQNDRMQAAIYFPLFLVLVDGAWQYSIYYLAADLQTPAMFKPRSPLSQTARRSGWQGFVYDLDAVKERIVRIR